jgi:hypothetical protein
LESDLLIVTGSGHGWQSALSTSHTIDPTAQEILQSELDFFAKYLK